MSTSSQVVQGKVRTMHDQEITGQIKSYAAAHCPFTRACDEPLEFELTKTAGGKTELVGRWYVHVWVPGLQCAYGLFVAVWQETETLYVGGVLDADGMQEIFEYYLSQPPMVKKYLRREPS